MYIVHAAQMAIQIIAVWRNIMNTNIPYVPQSVAMLPIALLPKFACHRCNEMFCVFFRSLNRISIPHVKTANQQKKTNVFTIEISLYRQRVKKLLK